MSARNSAYASKRMRFSFLLSFFSLIFADITKVLSEALVSLSDETEPL